MTDLQERLLAAHEADDKPHLVTLYTLAADAAEDIDAACFFLTHAYVFALDVGDERALSLAKRLAEHGREPPPGAHIF